MSKSTYAIGGCISVRVRMLEGGGVKLCHVGAYVLIE